MPDASSNGVCVRVSRVTVPPVPPESETTGCVEQAATAAVRVTAAEERRARLLAEAHAELAAELVVGDHDARLDQHLAHRRCRSAGSAGALPRAVLADVLVTNRMLVRGSTNAVPRLDRKRAPECPGRACPVWTFTMSDVRGLRVVELERSRCCSGSRSLICCLRLELLLFLEWRAPRAARSERRCRSCACRGPWSAG